MNSELLFWGGKIWDCSKATWQKVFSPEREPRQTAAQFGYVCCLIQAAQRGRWGPPSPFSNMFAGNRPWQECPSRAGKFLLLSAKVELAGKPQICLPRHLFQSIPYHFFGFTLDKARKTSVREHSQVKNHTDNVPKNVIFQPMLHDGNQKLWKSRLPHYFR